MSNANASLAKTFVSFAAASSEAIKALEAELCDVRTQLGHALEEAASNLEESQELAYQLDACRNDRHQLNSECERLQSELDRELGLSVDERDEDLCDHFLPRGECKVKKCRLKWSNDTIERLSKEHKWFGVRS